MGFAHRDESLVLCAFSLSLWALNIIVNDNK